MNILTRVYQKIFPSQAGKRIKKWELSGLEDARYIYDLDENSIVFDLGAYKGEWSSQIYAMYSPKIYLFEPVPLFFNRLKKKFFLNRKMFLNNFGLSNETKVAAISLNEESSSLYKKDAQSIQVILEDAITYFSKENIKRIDLMKINIEGGEYDLLEYMIRRNFVSNIRNIQVQFHDFVPSALERMRKIQNCLSKTHFQSYGQEFVWENWRLK